MKLKGYVCTVENPSYASANAVEAAFAGDARRIFEDEKGNLWIEIMAEKWIYSGEHGKVYTFSEWEEAHWENLNLPDDKEEEKEEEKEDEEEYHFDPKRPCSSTIEAMTGMSLSEYCGLNTFRTTSFGLRGW